MECRSLFCFGKFNNKLRIQSRDPNNREHKQKDFWQQRGDIVFSQSVQKEECSFVLKMDSRKANIE